VVVVAAAAGACPVGYVDGPATAVDRFRQRKRGAEARVLLGIRIAAATDARTINPAPVSAE
jgi:hypothetical protein